MPECSVFRNRAGTGACPYLFDKELAPFIPDFNWQVHDLSVLSDEEIRGGVFDRITLLLLRHIFDPDL
ncbi:MAG: hypothetical protein D3904_10645, partial [Candidatus Electrothrix sp. EH2]|nr:hypothetical protein [Candidatus Electrothrix sp. EH2]